MARDCRSPLLIFVVQYYIAALGFGFALRVDHMMCVLEHGHLRVTRSTGIASNVYVYMGKVWLDA